MKSLLLKTLLAFAVILAGLGPTLAAPGPADSGSLQDCHFEFDGSSLRLVCDDPQPAPTLTPTPTPTLDENDEGEPDEGSLSAVEDQPNILVIYTDDQRSNTFDAMPGVQSRIAADGVTFTNSFVTTPLCCPSRATFLTGLYAHNHGVLINRFSTQILDATSTLATWLDPTYETAFVGKYLNPYKSSIRQGTAVIPHGWDYWVAIDGVPKYDFTLFDNGVYRDSDPDEYATDALTDSAVSFIEGADEPFFLWLSYNAPHAPNDDPPGVTCPLDFPGQQSCSLAAIDQALDRVLDALGDQINNTFIVFTSDNGVSWGEHIPIAKKSCPYEECLRVPLIIRYPPVTGAGGFNVGAFVLNIDLAPTIAEIAGVATPEVDGLSLLGLLQSGGLPQARPDFLFEMADMEDDPSGRIEGVRANKWKLIVQADGSQELYKIKRDPGENKNLINKPRFQQIRQSMLARLDVLRQE